MDVLAMLLALASSFCFAMAFVAQQHVAVRIPPARAHGLRLFAQLARSGTWWAGFAGDTGGFVFQALALAFGSIVLVQPFLVVSMVFALPLAARWNGRRISRAELSWACVVVVFLAVFSVLAQPSAGDLRPPPARWIVPGAAILAAMGITLAFARQARGARRAAAMGVATGLAYGLVAVLTDVVVHAISGAGPAAALRLWETYALVVMLIAGTAIQQGAFHAGALGASLPATQVLEPVSGVVLGATVLGAGLSESPGTWAVMILALGAMAAGTFALARLAAAEPRPAATGHAGP